MNGIIIYWSSTGNTESMANKIAKDLGLEAKNVNQISVDEASKYDTLILGCPAMGAEELESDEFRPFFESLMNKTNNVKIALFGSYGWGGGEWMRTWEEEVKSLNKTLLTSGLISNGGAEEINPSEYQEFINAIKG